jgi:hypothetical protein
LDARVFPNRTSPDKLELDADRVRGQIGATLERLRTKLTPRNIVGEMAEDVGVSDLTPRAFFDFAARRHPVPTVLVGLGLGVLAFSALRSNEKSGSGALHESFAALAQSARKHHQGPCGSQAGRFCPRCRGATIRWRGASKRRRGKGRGRIGLACARAGRGETADRVGGASTPHRRARDHLCQDPKIGSRLHRQNGAHRNAG